MSIRKIVFFVLYVVFSTSGSDEVPVKLSWFLMRLRSLDTQLLLLRGRDVSPVCEEVQTHGSQRVSLCWCFKCRDFRWTAPHGDIVRKKTVAEVAWVCGVSRIICVI